MSLLEKIELLTANLPDADGARRFYLDLANKYPAEEKRLVKSEGLLSDVLTLAAFSPLLATTLLQHPNYISWLKRQRVSAKVRGKDELLESLARFALVNSQVEPNILLARFRRRELLRIYLRDIRNLGTIVEITEEISNLADAILEYALRLSRQELDNRYGIPLEIDEKERAKQAQFCIVALGKLGSNELNYASDIDLLFLYSNDGATSGQGSHKTVTNREYFVKLAEFAPLSGVERFTKVKLIERPEPAVVVADIFIEVTRIVLVALPRIVKTSVARRAATLPEKPAE